ncbi:unnamed protein product [Bemisia tabaci]|uniref:UDP-glucuronosyltransferase n=1 Tax=Bemisia tabaci TaxID=7038 RepID=A0A9P0C7Q1_BEMTA|nr:unnamed protein product [Bemisia tabaci]
MRDMKVTILLSALCMLRGCTTYNILVFLPNPIWSHYVQVEHIIHSLGLRGHNVTVMSPYPTKNGTGNVRHFFLAPETSPAYFFGNLMERFTEAPHPIFRLGERKRRADQQVPQLLRSALFRDLISNDNKFDLIFTELFFGFEAFVALGNIFNAPVVTYSSYGYDGDILRYSGAANAISYLSIKYLPYGGPMSLMQRLENTLLHIATVLYTEYWYLPHHDALLAEYIPGPLPRITDMLGNVSLFFLTANTALDGAKVYPPSVIEISGIHLKEPGPLDEDLKTIMDTAKNGVIFFCFGSILKASDFRREAIHAFLSVFEELDQTILWKADLNASEWNIPKNVHIKDWFPQTSVLAHPNCVLFLTHGGVSSMMEAIKHAVPVVGIPFYGDQIVNLANAEYFGYGLRVTYKNLSQQSLRWAMTTVLGDSRFKENIRKASNIFTDKPMSSLETALYWIEYVARHKGAHHLKPLAAKMPWYQLLLLDVIVVYLGAFIIILSFVVKIVSYLVKKYVFKTENFKKKIKSN